MTAVPEARVPEPPTCMTASQRWEGREEEAVIGFDPIAQEGREPFSPFTLMVAAKLCDYPNNP